MSNNKFIYLWLRRERNHNKKIPIDDINTDQYVIESEWNDYVGVDPVTKIINEVDKINTKNCQRS